MMFGRYYLWWIHYSAIVQPSGIENVMYVNNEEIINLGLDLIKILSFVIIVYSPLESRIFLLRIFPENYSRFFMKNMQRQNIIKEWFFHRHCRA